MTLARGDAAAPWGWRRGTSTRTWPCPRGSLQGLPLARAPCIHTIPRQVCSGPDHSPLGMGASSGVQPSGPVSWEGRGVLQTDVWRRFSLHYGLESLSFSEPQFPHL